MAAANLMDPIRLPDDGTAVDAAAWWGTFPDVIYSKLKAKRRHRKLQLILFSLFLLRPIEALG